LKLGPVSFATISPEDVAREAEDLGIELTRGELETVFKKVTSGDVDEKLTDLLWSYVVQELRDLRGTEAD